MSSVYFSISSPENSHAERSGGPKAPKVEASFFDRALKAINLFGNVCKSSTEEVAGLVNKQSIQPSKNLTTTIEHGIKDSSYFDENGEEQFVKVYTTTLTKFDQLGVVVDIVKQCMNGKTNQPCTESGAPL